MGIRQFRKATLGIAGTIAIIAAWHLGSTIVGSSLILPGPSEVLRTTLSLLGERAFWHSVLGTFRRVALAFALTMAAGSVAGTIAALSTDFDRFLSPLLSVIRATPVLALILLAMFWLPSDSVPIFSSFLMAFPVAFTSVKTGIASADKELLEMAALFRVPWKRQILNLRLPAASMHFLSAMKNSLGLCWKVVVAGEVLAQPLRGLGTAMQDARLSLETPMVFSWALVTVLLCGASEGLLGLAYERVRLRRWTAAEGKS